MSRWGPRAASSQGMTGVGQADDSVFTRISGFPIDVDADDTFVVSVDGIVLGEFSPGDTLRFSDYADALGDRLSGWRCPQVHH
jgi:hypothetical protein